MNYCNIHSWIAHFWVVLHWVRLIPSTQIISDVQAAPKYPVSLGKPSQCSSLYLEIVSLQKNHFKEQKMPISMLQVVPVQLVPWYVSRQLKLAANVFD